MVICSHVLSWSNTSQHYTLHNYATVLISITIPFLKSSKRSRLHDNLLLICHSGFPNMETTHFLLFFIFFHFSSRDLYALHTKSLALIISFGRVKKIWVVVRSRSRRLRTPPTGRSPTPSEEMEFSRKPKSLLFFAMLRSHLSCSLILENSTSSLAPAQRMYIDPYTSLVYKYFLFFFFLQFLGCLWDYNFSKP